MASREQLVRALTFLSRPTVAIGGAVLIGGACIAFAWYLTSASPSGAYAAVTKGPITEEVDVSGTVKAAQDTNLSFQTAGQVASIAVAVGDHVEAGQTLATLDNGAQAAALALAKAGLETEQAKLDSLESGTRPEQLAIDQTAATQAETALDDAVQSAYVSADDAVHAKADQVFSNPRISTAALIPLVPDATLVDRVEAERVALEPVLDEMQSLSAPGGDATVPADQMRTNLETVSTFLDDLSAALAEAVPDATTPASAITGYQANVNAARTEVSEATTAITAAETAYRSASGALTLAKAGATQDDVAAQQATVDAGKASVAAAEIALSRTYLTAPISGTISIQNADLGETVSPGQPLISIVSDGTDQADMQVSEIDVAKIKVGDPVEAAFGAYPGVTFPATVTTVPPAAAVTDGVPSYTVTVTFDKADPRVKPGLQGTLFIVTASKPDALQVPTSSIITDNERQFVYAKHAGGTVEIPVTTGITSASGTTEITNGLIVGDEVLTFGASAAH